LAAAEAGARAQAARAALGEAAARAKGDELREACKRKDAAAALRLIDEGAHPDCASPSGNSPLSPVPDANGKNVSLDAIQAVLGEIAAATTDEVFHLGGDEVAGVEEIGEGEGADAHAHAVEELAAGEEIVREVGRDAVAGMTVVRVVVGEIVGRSGHGKRVRGGR
jgi:hypothetical protein